MSIFLNISNHPSDKWAIEQIDAAMKLTTSIVDIKPPVVPPAYSIDEVIDLCDILVNSIPEMVTHAMVSTEYTLTASIVRKLQAKGIICFAATTERNILELTPNKKTVVFKFIQFREFPNLTTSTDDIKI